MAPWWCSSGAQRGHSERAAGEPPSATATAWTGWRWDDATVDLLYLDPPFKSKVSYNLLYFSGQRWWSPNARVHRHLVMGRGRRRAAGALRGRGSAPGASKNRRHHRGLPGQGVRGRREPQLHQSRSLSVSAHRDAQAAQSGRSQCSPALDYDLLQVHSPAVTTMLPSRYWVW